MAPLCEALDRRTEAARAVEEVLAIVFDGIAATIEGLSECQKGIVLAGEALRGNLVKRGGPGPDQGA